MDKTLFGSIVVAIISAFVVGAAFAQHAPLHQTPDCELQHSKVSVPIDLSGRKPTVMASINGKGPFKFFLDTGAGAAVSFEKKLASELGLTVHGTTRVGDPSNPSAIEADNVIAESIALGEATFRNVGGIAWGRSGLYSGENAPRGILGFPLFAKCLLTIDYPRSEMRLESGRLDAAAEHVVSFTTAEGGIPQIKVIVAGKEMPAHLDSGAMGAISIPSNMEKDFKWIKEPVVVGRGRTANSDFEIRAGEIEGTVQFAGHTFTNPKVNLSPVLDRIGFVNIGSALLKDFVVTIDSANHKMRLTRYETKGSNK